MNEPYSCAALDAPSRTPMRIRPGDRPMWVELRGCEGKKRRLRALAHDSELPVEVVVGLLLERDLVATEVGDLWDTVLDEATTNLGPARLGPGEKWREWVSQLRHGTTRTEDELPSLALPIRVLAQIPPAERAARILNLEPEQLTGARALDVAAALHGMTMQAWSLRCALRLAKH